MVAEISIDNVELVEKFKNKLVSIFSEENKKEKRYSEVWLTVEDFGGIPDSDNFVINVKTEPIVTSKILELKYIGLDLFKQLDKDEIPLYWHVRLFRHNERVRHTSDDIILIPNNPA